MDTSHRLSILSTEGIYHIIRPKGEFLPTLDEIRARIVGVIIAVQTLQIEIYLSNLCRPQRWTILVHSF